MGIDAKDRIEYEYKIFENVLERGATEEEIIEELKQNPQYSNKYINSIFLIKI